MGLDISVYKLLKYSDQNTKDKGYFRLVDPDGNYNDREFPSWAINLKSVNTEKWYDWDEYKKETGFDLNSYDWEGEEYSSKGCFMNLRKKKTNKLVTIDLEKVPLKEVPVYIIGRKEIGYQRKGLNGKFYEDYRSGKIGYFVWTKAELERYKQEYCDDPYEYVYPNGTKSGEIIYPKENFQKNIIDPFIEGECCVIFSW